MKTSMNILSALVLVAAAGSLHAQGSVPERRGGFDNIRSDFARVVDVQRVGGTYSNRISQECWNERTNRNETGYYRDNSGRLYRGDNSGKSGTMIGAIGRMRDEDDDKHINFRNDGYQHFQGDAGNIVRCRTVTLPDGSYGRRGYRVTYEYAGQTYQAFTTVRPGRTIPVIVDVRPQ